LSARRGRGIVGAVDFSGVRIVIDPDGYRPNVGIVLMRADGQVFWARRVRRDGWQFPQGGMRSDETPTEAMYRELHEETGLSPEHVELLGATPGWLRYRLPGRAIRRGGEGPVCIGQKQVWFLLRLLGDEYLVRFDATETPEFDHFRWVDFWYPVEHVVSFKRGVYARALRHLAPVAEGSGAALRQMPPAAEQAWLPGSSAGHDRPRRRPSGARGPRGSRGSRSPG